MWYPASTSFRAAASWPGSSTDGAKITRRGAAPSATWMSTSRGEARNTSPTRARGVSWVFCTAKAGQAGSPPPSPGQFCRRQQEKIRQPLQLLEEGLLDHLLLQVGFQGLPVEQRLQLGGRDGLRVAEIQGDARWIREQQPSQVARPLLEGHEIRQTQGFSHGSPVDHWAQHSALNAPTPDLSPLQPAPTPLSWTVPRLGSGLTVGQQILVLSGEGSNPSSPTNQGPPRGPLIFSGKFLYRSTRKGPIVGNGFSHKAATLR